MTYTNPGNNNIVCTFKIEVTQFVYLILNRVKFTRIAKVPKYLPKRANIKFYKMFQIFVRNSKYCSAVGFTIAVNSNVAWYLKEIDYFTSFRSKK